MRGTEIPTTHSVAVPAGPGTVQVHVNAVLPTSEHSTHVYAYGRDTARPRDIVVDRLMRWGSGTEGQRSPGSSTRSSVWEFAEGGHGFFTTYVAVFNPNPVATTVRVYYRHENGSVYSQDVGLPALGRAVVGDAVLGADRRLRPQARLAHRPVDHGRADGVRGEWALASQEQMGEKSGRVIAGAGHANEFRDAVHVAAEYGGDAADWVKKSSRSYNARDGSQFETHWVENIKTGERVLYKTKITK